MAIHTYKTTVPVRFRTDYFNKETTLKELKRMNADRVALTLKRDLIYRFKAKDNLLSTPEILEKLKVMIEFFKENGFEVMVWFGETFGHDPNPPIKGIPYTNMRFFGKGDISAFCPLDENFRSDICKWVKAIAKCGAEMIMFDDDYRLGHRPGGLACCCGLHMAALEKELGEHFTEDEFRKKAFTGGKNRYRDAWIKVNAETMRSFSVSLREAVNEVNPRVRLGFCTAPCSWDSDGLDAISTAKALAGDTRPFIRLGGAPYWVGNTTALGFKISSVGDVVEYSRAQAKWCKGVDIETFSEGDTYPRPRFFTPSAYLECFDMILRASGETGGILKYALDYISDAEYETGYIDAHVENRELYAQIDRAFSGKKTVGLCPFNAMRLLETRELDCEKRGADLLRIQDNLTNPATSIAPKLSLPISYEDGSVNILFGENARFIEEEKLKNGAIIDVTAARILTERGIDVGIKSITPKTLHEKTGFSDQPSEYFIKEDRHVFFEEYPAPAVEFADGAEVQSRIVQGSESYDASAYYENEKGYKFLILPAEASRIPRGAFDSYCRARQLMEAAERFRGEKYPFSAEGNHPMLYTMIKENDVSAVIGLWNLFADKINSMKISVNIPFGDVNFINCTGKLDGNTVLLDAPIQPYGFAAVEVKKA